MNRTNDKALAAKLSGLEMLSGESELKAFYAGFRKAGKGPSKEHPALDVNRTNTGWWTVHALRLQTRDLAGRQGKGRRGQDVRRAHRRPYRTLPQPFQQILPPSSLTPALPHSMTRARSVISYSPLKKSLRLQFTPVTGYWTRAPSESMTGDPTLLK